MKQFWKTGLALLVLVGLTLYIWHYEWGKEVGPDEPKETILSVEKDRATAISIESIDAETIRLSKVDGSWQVGSPFEAPADESAVGSMLNSLEGLETNEDEERETGLPEMLHGPIASATTGRRPRSRR